MINLNVDYRTFSITLKAVVIFKGNKRKIDNTFKATQFLYLHL